MHQAGLLATKGSASFAYRAAKRLTASITPEEQEQLRAETAELRAAMHDTRAALVGRYDLRRRRKAWARHEDRVLHRPPHVVIAQMLIKTLREQGPMDETSLAGVTGTSAEDEDFRQALALATTDGHIVADTDGGPLAARTAESLLERHPLLRALGETKEAEIKIVEAVEDEGALSRDELRAAVGMDVAREDTELVFDVALEQAIATGGVEWLGDHLYGIKAEEASNFGTKRGDAPTVGKAAQRLTLATIKLSRELGKLRRAVGQPGGTTSPGPPAAETTAPMPSVASMPPAAARADQASQPLPSLSFDESSEQI